MNQFSYQADDETLRLIAELAGWWGLPAARHNTPVIARSVERAHAQEKAKRGGRREVTVSAETLELIDVLGGQLQPEVAGSDNEVSGENRERAIRIALERLFRETGNGHVLEQQARQGRKGS